MSTRSLISKIGFGALGCLMSLSSVTLSAQVAPFGAKPETKGALSGTLIQGRQWGVPTPLVDGINDFSWDFFFQEAQQQLKGEALENAVISPFSISTALSIVYLGARGKTAAQMATVLGYPKEPMEALAHSFGSLLDTLSNPNADLPFNLNIAKAVWVPANIDLLPDYTDLLERYYNSPMYQTNFLFPQAAAAQINYWVQRETEGKIAQLISPMDINDNTKMVVTSALYLKADWLQPFDASQTKSAPFHMSPKEAVTVPMMHKTGMIPFFENSELTLVALPYKGEATGPQPVMLLIMPNESSSLAQLHEKLSYKSFLRLLEGLENRVVDLAMPKFKIESSVKAADLLKDMGMMLAFSDLADFSGINGKRNLLIDKILHKTFLEVDEAGTEAAAATAVTIGLKSEAPIKAQQRVVFDRPFVSVILDLDTAQILFLSQIINPLQGS